MFISGFMGSPRKKGNTHFLLTMLLEKLEAAGATTRLVNVPKKNILPCTGCGHCERKGTCFIDDDMQTDIFPLLKKSDIVIIAAPVYFYTVPSQLKAMIDRSQTLWSRKYVLKLNDPAKISRKGYLLGVGATKGKALFDPMELTAKYFFDAIGAEFAGSLTYGGIDSAGELKEHKSVISDVEKEAARLAGLFTKKTILFTCSQNTGRSQMAGAFAKKMAGDRFNILTAGSMPAEKVETEIEQSMAEKGIDIGFIKPESIDSITAGRQPDYVVTINSGEETCITIPGAQNHIWAIENPAGKEPGPIAAIRDEIEKKTTELIKELS